MTNKGEKLNSALKFIIMNGLSDLQYSLKDQWPWMPKILREMNFEGKMGNSMLLQRYTEALFHVSRDHTVCAFIDQSEQCELDLGN